MLNDGVVRVWLGDWGLYNYRYFSIIGEVVLFYYVCNPVSAGTNC